MADGKGRGPRVGENGNWLCPKCQNVNYGRRDKCNLCATLRPISGPSFGSSRADGWGQSASHSFPSSAPGSPGPGPLRSPYLDELATNFLTAFRGQYDPLKAAVDYLYTVDTELRAGIQPLSGSHLGFGGGFS